MNINGKKEMELQKLIGIEYAINNFGDVIKNYREKELLSLNDLASRVGCSGTYILRAEKGSKRVPIHMKVRIPKKGLDWKADEIEWFLIEIVKRKEKLDS